MPANHSETQGLKRAVDVTLAIVTYRRNAGLGILLPRLIEQGVASREQGRLVEILVVDNDPLSGARPVVEAAAHSCPSLPIRWVGEPHPGIAAARNRALDSCETPVLVFIDDDELPSERWLEHLVRAYERTGAVAVAGPVEPVYVTAPPPWIRDGPFHASPQIPDGSEMTHAATSNLLLDMTWVRASGARMPDVGTRGGEDVIFTERLRRAGGRLVWSADAVVREEVPPNRLTPRWVLARSLTDGNNDSSRILAARCTASRRLLLTGRGLARVGIGTFRAAAAFVRDRQGGVGQGAHTAMRGAGMALGAWDIVYDGYAREGMPRWSRSTPSDGRSIDPES